MGQLSDVVSQVTEPVDQSPGNLNVIAGVATDASSLLNTDDFSTDISVGSSVSGV